jgi:hypothetical protein
MRRRVIAANLQGKDARPRAAPAGVPRAPAPSLLAPLGDSPCSRHVATRTRHAPVAEFSPHSANGDTRQVSRFHNPRPVGTATFRDNGLASAARWVNQISWASFRAPPRHGEPRSGGTLRAGRQHGCSASRRSANVASTVQRSVKSQVLAAAIRGTAMRHATSKSDCPVRRLDVDPRSPD